MSLVRCESHLRCQACASCLCPHVIEAIADGVMPEDVPEAAPTDARLRFLASGLAWQVSCQPVPMYVAFYSGPHGVVTVQHSLS